MIRQIAFVVRNSHRLNASIDADRHACMHMYCLRTPQGNELKHNTCGCLCSSAICAQPSLGPCSSLDHGQVAEALPEDPLGLGVLVESDERISFVIDFLHLALQAPGHAHQR